MHLARPYSVVSPTLEGDVLVVLAGTTKPLTGRDVARLVRRGTPPAVAAALDRLVAQGLVEREQVGRAFLHVLNRDHVAAAAVEALASLRMELVDRLSGLFSSWTIPPVQASMFGSAARGDGDVDSDVDLFVVRPAQVGEEDERWRSQLSDLSARVLAWTGNDASVIELSESEIPRLLRSRPPVLAELRADNIQLAGATLRELLEGAREPA